MIVKFTIVTNSIVITANKELRWAAINLSKTTPKMKVGLKCPPQESKIRVRKRKLTTGPGLAILKKKILSVYYTTGPEH